MANGLTDGPMPPGHDVRDIPPPVPPAADAVGSPGSHGDEPAAAGQPVSFAQRQLWIVEQVFPDSLNHVPVAYRLRGDLDIAAIEAAFTELLARHNVLRSCYQAGRDGTPF